MIYLVVGRTGAGKNYFIKKLIEISKQINGEPLKEVKSYTTRPPHTPDEDTHIFISKEEATNYKDKMVAYTKIDDYEYFVTDEQVRESDLYIIDPREIEELVNNMPDIDFQIVYVRADDDMNRKINAIKRAEDMIEEEKVFDARNAAEDEQFTDFEEKIDFQMDYECCFPKNITVVITVINDYSDDCMDKYATMLVNKKNHIRKLCTVVKECMQLGILMEGESTDEYGNKKIIAHHHINDEVIEKEHSIEHCALSLIGDDENFAKIIGEYIALSPRFEPM